MDDEGGNKMVKILITILILFLSSIAVAGDVYTWTDANGVKRFTNTAPPADAANLGKESNYVAPPPEDKPSYMTNDTKRDKPMTFDTQSKAPTEKRPYKYDWSSPRVSGNELSLSGTVSYGESCKRLNIMVKLFSENGNTAYIKCQASDVGGSGSRILEGKTSIVSRWGSNWKVEETRATCD